MVVPPKFVHSPCNIIMDVLTLLLLNSFSETLSTIPSAIGPRWGHATASPSNAEKVFFGGHYNRDHF